MFTGEVKTSEEVSALEPGRVARLKSSSTQYNFNDNVGYSHGYSAIPLYCDTQVTQPYTLTPRRRPRGARESAASRSATMFRKSPVSPLPSLPSPSLSPK